MRMPKFLQAVELSDADKEALSSQLKNWLVAQIHIRKATSGRLMQMLAFEVSHLRRDHMVERIHGRLVKRRQEEERAQLTLMR
jgi:hypothetical protein